MRSLELFLNFLTQRGVLTSKRCADVASIIEKQQGSNIVEILVRGGFVNSEDLARNEAEFFNLEVCRLDKKIPDQILSTLPFELARDCGAICFFVSGCFVKMALLYPDAENMAKLSKWSSEKQLEIKYYICSLVDYEKQLNSYLVRQTVLKESKQEDMSDFPNDYLETLPVDNIIAIILREAVSRKTSEILFSKENEHVLIRFRSNSGLMSVANLPVNFYIPLINYLKGLAHLPLSIKTNFLEGEIQIVINKAVQKFELKVLESINGEVLSVKTGNVQSGILDFEQLGFNKHLQQIIGTALDRADGKIVIVGSSGSGKTTTLHSLIQQLSGSKNYIVTIEKNIENNLPGVTRIQVKPEMGLTYENVLQEINRWQPDYLVLDEIDNNEIGFKVLHSILSGTPVMTTVNGDSIVQGLEEIFKLDLEIHYLATILNLILAQKIIRRVCSHCLESSIVPNNISKKVLNILGSVPLECWPRGLDYNAETIYAPRAAGCSWCNHTGYNGKLVIQEGLLFDDHLRQEFAQISKKNELAVLIQRYLTINMLQDGLMKALTGLTTLDEVFSNCEEYNII